MVAVKQEEILSACQNKVVGLVTWKSICHHQNRDPDPDPTCLRREVYWSLQLSGYESLNTVISTACPELDESSNLACQGPGCARQYKYPIPHCVQPRFCMRRVLLCIFRLQNRNLNRRNLIDQYFGILKATDNYQIFPTRIPISNNHLRKKYHGFIGLTSRSHLQHHSCNCNIWPDYRLLMAASGKPYEPHAIQLLSFN